MRRCWVAHVAAAELACHPRRSPSGAGCVSIKRNQSGGTGANSQVWVDGSRCTGREIVLLQVSYSLSLPLILSWTVDLVWRCCGRNTSRKDTLKLSCQIAWRDDFSEVVELQTEVEWTIWGPDTLIQLSGSLVLFNLFVKEEIDSHFLRQATSTL
jgi:hypothetical protein